MIASIYARKIDRAELSPTEEKSVTRQVDHLRSYAARAVRARPRKGIGGNTSELRIPLGPPYRADEP